LLPTVSEPSKIHKFVNGKSFFQNDNIDTGVLSQNAVGTMADQSYLRSGAGIIALEAYHAGAVRMLLLQQGATIVAPFSTGLADITSVRYPTERMGAGSG
jgi:hypothetical protein